MSNWYDREEAELYASHERGEIDSKTLSKLLRELAREYRDAADEAAENAANRERENW